MNVNKSIFCLFVVILMALSLSGCGGTAFTAITVGSDNICALTRDGGVKCWGNNEYGQLGDGTNTSSAVSVPVAGLSNVAGIGTGGSYTCALISSGGVKCWGYNSAGDLGDGTTTNRNAPVDVSGLRDIVKAIGEGRDYSCVLTSTGGVKCWGANIEGELGDGTNTFRNAPVDVSGLTGGVTEIAIGFTNACALTGDGGVKCWGDNSNGELGDGTTTNRNTPVDVSGLTSGLSAISEGDGSTCALTTSGGVKCWGNNSRFGPLLGNNTTTDSSVPVDVSGLTSGVVKFTLGESVACALTSEGGVKCWGDNSNGGLGDGTTTDRRAAVDVSGLTSGVVQIVAGEGFACAVTSGGGAKCWGRNFSGQLGNGTQTNSSVPVDVSGLTSGVKFIAIDAYGMGLCALTTKGDVKCWGNIGSFYSSEPTDFH